MKLSELILDYRKRMNISQREFSRRCDLSNTYISFLENEKNPKTNKPIIPTLEQYGKIAHGKDISVHHLFELLDSDAPVDLRSSAGDSESPDIDPEIHIVSGMMETMTKEEKQQVIDLIRVMMRKH